MDVPDWLQVFDPAPVAIVSLLMVGVAGGSLVLRPGLGTVRTGAFAAVLVLALVTLVWTALGSSED
jgi:hypothetical protein